MEPMLPQLLDKAGNVSGVRDQQIDAADAHPQEKTPRQREDVIQWQRADDEQLLGMRRLSQDRLHPGVVLQYVGDNVAVKQRRALGDAGGAAGVLKKRYVIRRDLWRSECQVMSGLDRVVERHRVRKGTGFTGQFPGARS